MKNTMSLLGLLLFGRVGYSEASEKPELPRPPALMKQRTLHIDPPSQQPSPLSSPLSPIMSPQWSPRSPRSPHVDIIAKYNLDSPPPKTAALMAIKNEHRLLQAKLATIGEGPNRVVEKELEDCLKKLYQLQIKYPHLKDKKFLAWQINKLKTIHEKSQQKKFLTTPESTLADTTEDDHITMTVHLPAHVQGALAARIKSPAPAEPR